MKGRIEAADLHKARQTLLAGLDQRDFARQMLGIQRGEPAQFVEHGRGDRLRSDELRTAMNNSVPHRRGIRQADALVEHIEERLRRRGQVTGRDRLRCDGGFTIAKDQRAIALPNPFDTPREEPRRRIAWREQRELQTRRAAIERQNRISHQPRYLASANRK